MKSQLEQRCREYGLRMSGQRKVIIRVLGEARDHPAAEDVHKRASKVDPRISLATVYRTLNLLVEAGLLSRVAFGDRKAHYEEARGAQHHHLVDVRTGEILEFRDSALEAYLREATRQLGYQLLQFRLEVFGETNHASGGIAPPGHSARSVQAQVDIHPPIQERRHVCMACPLRT